MFPTDVEPTQASLRKNRLLASLPQSELLRLSPHLDLVSLRIGETLYESGERSMFAYFPTTAMISLLYVVENGASGDLLGNEGILGVALFLGDDTTPIRAAVQSTGQAYRMNGEFLRQESSPAGALHDLLLRFSLVRLTQMMQNAVCNRCHSTEQQFCRWLLLSLDRLSPDAPWIARELIATMLGIEGEVMDEAAGRLERAGLIQLRQSRIKVVDRRGLEIRVCECYSVVRQEYRRLFPDATAE